MSRRVVRPEVLSLLVAAAVGCAEERDPIIRVQPNALHKEFFVGRDLAGHADDPEFYWRNYVIDGSATQSLIGIGSWSTVERVRWEITETRLLAHKAYQHAVGADDKGVPGQEPDGTVVAAYPILSHFDIRREYNPTTGEEMNVIVENTMDRAWYEREFMRVDWSQNLVDTPIWDDLFMGKVFGNIDLTPLVLAVDDPESSDAPHFEMKNGYFDVTSRYWVKPDKGEGGLPTCALVGLYTGSATYECDPQLAVVRSSYLRVDPEADFERLEITRAPLEVVGNPAGIAYGSLFVGLVPPGEQGWDPRYGYPDSLHHRFAHVHDIWVRSHQAATCDSNADADADGSADACANGVTGYAGDTGSQCDTFAKRCTIPYRDREVKTVGYWVNDKMPDELQDPVGPDGLPAARGAVEDVIYGWNQLLSGAVARAREVECRRTGGERTACHEEFFDGQEMLSYGAWLIDKARDPTPVLTLCHNPVRSYDLRTPCGPAGYSARLGDIRHNFVAYWPHASRVPWGGIGNWGSDPRTGQILGASAMIMGRSATLAAAKQRDVLQLAMGDTSVEQIASGEHADNYVKALRGGARPRAMDAAELTRRIASVDPEHAAHTIQPLKLHQGADVAARHAALIEQERKSAADGALLEEAQAEVGALASRFQGSVYEAALVDGGWLNATLGLSPESSVDDALEAASPLRALSPARFEAARARIDRMLEARGACFGDAEAPVFGGVTLPSLAAYFKAKYPDGEYTAEERGEAIYRDLWIEAFKGIAVHEVGHSLGLLHNFASSWDAPNYHPQYWQLRTHEGASMASCKGKPRTGDTASIEGDGCMGPRYLDPETDDERGLGAESRPGIDYFGNTSVMEYHIDRFDETVGLGQYDAHAMKALYGRVLETFDDEAHGGLDPAEQAAFGPRLESQLADQDRVIRKDGPFPNVTFDKPTHYTALARKMRVFDPARCREATAEEKAQAGWRLVHGKVCAPPPKDHAAWGDFESALTQEQRPWSMAPYLRTRAGSPAGAGRLRWMYRYGTAANSYFHTSPGDAGADAYEVTTNTVRQFDGTYPWTYFRRTDREYNFAAIPLAILRTTLERLRAYHWNVANRNAFYHAVFTEAQVDEIVGSDDWHRPQVVAETVMFDTFARILLMPEPGDYGPLEEQPAGTTRTIFDAGQGDAFSLGLGDGRYIAPDYDSGPDGGGSWNYQNWMIHAGFGVEKIFAAMALTDGRPVLSQISRENYLDGRGSRINFRNDMPVAIDRLLGGVLSEDWEAVGMWVGEGKTPSPQTTPLWDAEPERPKDAKVLFPNFGYKQALGTLLFSHMFSRTGTDMTLSNKLRVWLLGQEGEVDVPPEQQIRFRDPASGYTYVARKYGTDVIDGKIVDRGIASRMVRHANDLLAASYETERDESGAVLLDEFGTPVLVMDADGQPIPKPHPKSRAGELTRYVGLLDASRQIGRELAYGPLGGVSNDD